MTRKNVRITDSKDYTDDTEKAAPPASSSVESVHPCQSVIQTTHKHTEAGPIPEDWEAPTIFEVLCQLLNVHISISSRKMAEVGGGYSFRSGPLQRYGCLVRWGEGISSGQARYSVTVVTSGGGEGIPSGYGHYSVTGGRFGGGRAFLPVRVSLWVFRQPARAHPLGRSPSSVLLRARS